MDTAEHAYKLLGVPVEATEAEIKKAYRKLALIKHPDKNPNNPHAADEFAALQKAYDLLLDPDARKALDNLLSAQAARAERTAFRDEKRQKMMQDLERRERNWERARTQEESARAKLQQEIERLRRQAAEREAKAQAERHAAAASAAAQAAEPGAAEAAALAAAAAAGQAESDDMLERLGRTLKVSWSRKDGEYTAPQLRQIFAAHGEVEDVVMREGKKKKGSALVVMRTEAGAAAAAHSVNGELSRPLLVVPFSRAGAAAGGEEETISGRLHPQHPAAGAGAAARPLFAAAAGGNPPYRPPAFAAGAAAAPVGALGAKPSVPLFAAGAARPSLFPGAAAASTNRTAANRSASTVPSSSAGRPLFAAGAGAACGGRAAGSAAVSGGFSSFNSSAFASTAARGGLEGATLANMRQAEERKRLIAQMEQEEGAA